MRPLLSRCHVTQTLLLNILLIWVTVCFAHCCTNSAVAQDEGNYSLSAAVARNRELEVIVEAIPTAIQKSDHSRVAELLSELLSQQDQGFVHFRGTDHHASALARQFIQSLPPATLNAYQRKLEKEAQSALELAISQSDLLQLELVETRYPGTPAGYKALELYIAAASDRGETEKGLGLTENELEQTTASPLVRVLHEHLLKFKDQLPTLVDEPENSSVLAADFRPSALPVWSVKYPLTSVSLQTAATGQRDLRENGLTPFSPWNAAAMGNNLLTISPTHLELRSRASGELIWSRPLPQYGARILDKLTNADSPLRSWNISRAVLFRLFGESLYSNFSHDHHAVYLVEETKSGGSFAPDDKKNHSPANQVVCLHAETGTELWATSLLKDSIAYICSPPQVWGSEVLVLAEFRDTPQIKLLALNKETGELNRSLILANIAKPIEAGSATERDGRRQKFACPIKIIGTKAYCPTSAGLLATVNLLKWQVDWLYRYPRHDVAQSGAGFAQPNLGLTGYQWWSGWNEIQCLAFEDKLVFASPESQRLTLFDRVSGEVFWTAKRDDGLYLATADQEHGVVVIGSHFARAHATLSGEVLWKTPLNFPVGRGIRIRDHYLLPDSELGWTLLDLKTGEAIESPLNISPKLSSFNLTDVETPRNFVQLDNQLYELSYKGIQRFPAITEVSNSGAILNPAQRFLHLLETNSTTAAVKLYRDQGSETPPDPNLSQLFHQELIRNLSSGSFTEFPPLRSATLSNLFPAIWFSTSLKDALDNNNLDSLQRILIEQLSRPLAESFKSSRNVRTRIDRWLISNLLKKHASSTPDEQYNFKNAIREALNSRLLDQPTEREFLGELFSETPWEIDKDTNDSAPMSTLQDFVSSQIQQISQAARQSTFLETAPTKSEWSSQPPVVTQDGRLSGNIFFESVPILNIDGTAHTKLNLEIEFPGHRGVRFSGQHWERPWSAYLPATDRSLRMERELVNAWAVGPVIVLQVGSEVFGISPLTSEGNPGAKLLWPTKGTTIDTLGDRSNQLLSFESISFPKRIGFPEKPDQRMNEFGYYATAVGPVRAGYFCLQQKGMLVAYETSTGKEIWRRNDLPQQALCLGNEDQVVVIADSRPTVQVFSARDGEELSSREIPPSGDSLLSVSGVHALYQVGGKQSRLIEDDPVDNLTLKWVNLASNQIVWEREWTTASIPFGLESRWVGVCAVNGKIDIVDISTGLDVNSLQIAVPEKISRIACHSGDKNLLVLISGEIEDEKLLNATQQNKGFRRELIDGPLFCIDRQDASLLWKSKLDSAVFPLVQPVDLPVFVTAGRRFPEESMDDRTPGSRVQLFNRQTGESLYNGESLNPISRYNVSGHLESGKVTLTTREAIISAEFQQRQN